MRTLFSSLSFTNRQWNDVVFENRHKNDGAYYIRTHYNQNLARALFFSTLLFVVPFAGSLLLKGATAANVKSYLPKVIDTITLHPFTIEPPIQAIAQPQAVHRQVTLPVNEHTIRRIVDDITPLQQPPTATETPATIIPATEGGSGTGPAITASSGTAGNTIVTTIDSLRVWQVAGVMPEFPGGEKAMNNYIVNHAQLNQMWKESGTEGKIYFQFVVDRDGTVTDVNVISDRIGYGVADDNKALFLHMPKWKPGRQNGHNVRVMLRLPLTLKKY